MSDHASNFIRTLIDEDRKAGRFQQLVTRFPPEPNGYLHIGHAKSICLNFGLATTYGGRCHLRFDDTNPTKEDIEYAEAIQRDIRWLGFEWGEHLYHASDYFPQLYTWAQELIRAGKAYVDEESEEEIRAHRGTVDTPGTPSRYRDRPAEESLELLEAMRKGERADGSMVLRAKIDLAHPNMKMRDPLMYRVRNIPHDRTGDTWHIYPFYDYAHGLSDAIEGITHSFCTLEFENNRPLYDWFIDTLGITPRPYQTEFARLSLAYTMMSKRKLLILVEEGLVEGWDDPRMPTLAGLRRRGVTAAAIRAFIDRVGMAKANSLVDMVLLENAIRDDLNHQAPRMMAVLDPVEVVVESWPEGEVDEIEASLWPHDVDRQGSRTVPFTRRLYVDRADFMEEPTKGFFRLAPGREVRLRYGYLVTCTGVEKDSQGRISRILVRHDPNSRGGNPADGRKVRGTLHWVSAERHTELPVRLYDRLFKEPIPGADNPWREDINPASLRRVRGLGEPALAELKAGEHVQLERVGYFYADPIDSAQGAPVLNRVVSLKDSWTKQRAAPKRLTPKPVAGPAKAKEVSPEVAAKAAELVQAHGLPLADAEVIATTPERLSFYTAAVTKGAPTETAKLFVNVLLAETKEQTLAELAFEGPAFGELAELVHNGTLSSTLAKKVLQEMLQTGASPASVVEARGLAVISDPAVLGPIIRALLENHPKQVEAYRGGKNNLLGFFIGKVMQATRGKAKPDLVRQLLLAAL